MSPHHRFTRRPSCRQWRGSGRGATHHKIWTTRVLEPGHNFLFPAVLECLPRGRVFQVSCRSGSIHALVARIHTPDVSSERAILSGIASSHSRLVVALRCRVWIGLRCQRFSCCFPNEAVPILLWVTKWKARSAAYEAEEGCTAGNAGADGAEDASSSGPTARIRNCKRIAQISDQLLSVNQGTLYPVLLRLEQECAVASEWGPSENNRRARFYRLTRAGEKLLEAERRDWEQTAAIIARFFEVKAEDLA